MLSRIPLGGCECSYPHWAGRDTEAQQGEPAWYHSMRKQGVELGWESRTVRLESLDHAIATQGLFWWGALPTTALCPLGGLWPRPSGVQAPSEYTDKSACQRLARWPKTRGCFRLWALSFISLLNNHLLYRSLIQNQKTSWKTRQPGVGKETKDMYISSYTSVNWLHMDFLKYAWKYPGRCKSKWDQGNSVPAGRMFCFKLCFWTFELCGYIAREKKKDKDVNSLAIF